MKKTASLYLCLTFAIASLLLHPLAAMADCPTFIAPAQLGTVESSLLTEISGVAASRENANVLWVHNDSGDSARIYAMSIQGRHLGVYNLVGASATDWEDIAIGPGPVEGQDYVYAGDIGDNARSRSSVTVYRVAEPSVSTTQDPVTVNLNGVDALPMQYPGPEVYDCEALLVDPVSGDLFLVTKDRAGEGLAHVFRNPAPQTPGVMVTLELVDSIPMSSQVTGGDVSPFGDGILLRLYFQAYHWSRATGTNLWEAFSGTACTVPLAVEPQGEAIAFAADGLGYFTISEGASQPVYFYEKDTSTVLVPTGSTWRYLDDGSDQGTAWRQSDFDDSGWASGPAQLGYGDGDEATVVSYGGDAENKHITTYFRHSFDVEDASIFESVTLRILRDDGAVVYLNGTEVLRTNMPGGAIGYSTLADSTVGGGDEAAFFMAGVDPGLLNDGPNVLAVEIHQAAVTSSDISFDLELRGQESREDAFTFAITTDIRSYSGPGYDSSQYFRGACEAIASRGRGAFMFSPGDIDPPTDVRWTITSTLGTTYTWYPVVGNHELPGSGQEPYPGANMAWLRSCDYGSVNPGPSGCPETTYSFDYQNAHFVVLNEYCDTAGDTVRDGDVPDHLYDWLAADLSATDKTHIFVFGHEPAYPQPDADNGRTRHLGDSLDQYPAHRDRFWNLLRDEGVVAYVCGHTHNYSAVEIDGVWQLDAGHARGQGDTGARSTFTVINVDANGVTFKTYRDDADGGPYVLAHTGTLRECVAGYDFDCDCDVDIADIMAVASRWHTAEGDEDYDPLYDLNDDSRIDIVDIMLVAVHWGESCQDPKEDGWSPIGASGGGWLTAIAISSDNPNVVYVGCDVGGIYKSTDDGESWQIINNGLTNYYVQDIVIDPQTPTATATLYAATQGGVFKSTDSGDTWVIKRDGFPPVSRYTFSAPIAKILVDPANPNIVYAGVGTPHHEGHQSVYWLGVVEKGVVYKSTDYGETWTKIRNTGIDTNAMIYSMAIDHHNRLVLYVNTDYGVYKSTDAGNTWQSKNTGLPHLHTRDIIIDSTNSNVLYLTIWATPGSVSWEGGVYKSTDAAESWVAKNGGLAQAMGDPSESTFLTSNYKNIVINPQNPQILYVANTSWWPEPGIFKTTDGGDNWMWVTRNEEPNINIDLGWIDWGPQAYCLAIDPDDPDRLFFGSDGIICKTEDAGESWMQVYTDSISPAYWQGRGFETTCAMDVAVDPTNPDNVYVGYCDIGFLKSNDGGTSFKKTESGMNYPANTFAIAIDPDNPNVLYTGTGDLLTWGTNQGEICKSTDYGETWNVIGGPGNGLPDAQVWSLALDANSDPDSRTLYAASYQDGIYKTTDGGASWFAVNNGLGINRNIRRIVIDPINSNTLYAGIEGYDEGLATVQGGIYKTSDGGQNWIRIDTNPPQPGVLDLAIDPADSNIIYSATREHYDHTQQTMYLGGVYKSTDEGSNWTRLNSGFGDSDNLNVGALAINPQNPEIIYAGTFDDNFHDESSGRGIFKSTDGGVNWTPINDGLGILYTTVITIDPSDHSRLYVGTHGNSVFTRIDD